jgi:hypothetical protein
LCGSFKKLSTNECRFPKYREAYLKEAWPVITRELNKVLLHPTPCTRNPTPETIHPAPESLDLEPSSRNHKPYDRNPKL